MPQTRRGNAQQAKDTNPNLGRTPSLPKKRSARPAPRGSKRSRVIGGRNPTSNTSTSRPENDTPEPRDSGVERDGRSSQNAVSDEDEPHDSDDAPEDEDTLQNLNVENYIEFTKDWTMGRIRLELKRRRDLNRKITPQEAHDEGVLIMRESERRIAALALAARVSEHTLKKSM